MILRRLGLGFAHLGAELKVGMAQLAQLSKLWPKVVPPVGDAMCLVDREERDWRGAQSPEKFLILVELLR